MKRCPECGREYDNTMAFCLDDGAELLYGPASMDEPATAILSTFGVPPSGGFAGDLKTELFENRQTFDDSRQLTGAPQSVLPPEGGTQSSFGKRLVLVPIALAVIV